MQHQGIEYPPVVAIAFDAWIYASEFSKRMARAVVVLGAVVTGGHANAADLPNRHAAPSLPDPIIRSCGGLSATGLASLPHDATACAEVSDSDAALCRRTADKARFDAWREVVLQRCLAAAKWRHEIARTGR
jgi:hypothetical protein